VFESRVPKKIFKPKKEKEDGTGCWRNCVLRNFVIGSHEILFGGSNQGVLHGWGMWHVWWRDVVSALVEKSERDNLEDVDIDGSIISRDNVKKQNG